MSSSCINTTAPPPINLSAERSVLGALIEDDSLLPKVIAAGLRAQDFALPDHRRIFATMLAMHERGTPLDYITLVEQLGNRAEDYVLLDSLITGVVLNDDHVLHHVHILRRKSKLRTLQKIAEWLTSAANDPADPDVVLAETIAKLEAGASREVLLER